MLRWHNDPAMTDESVAKLNSHAARPTLFSHINTKRHFH